MLETLKINFGKKMDQLAPISLKNLYLSFYEIFFGIWKISSQSLSFSISVRQCRSLGKVFMSVLPLSSNAYKKKHDVVRFNQTLFDFIGKSLKASLLYFAKSTFRYRMIMACTHCSMQCYSDEASLNWPSIQAKQITLFVFSRRNKADHQNNGQVFPLPRYCITSFKRHTKWPKTFSGPVFHAHFCSWCDTLYQVQNPTD